MENNQKLIKLSNGFRVCYEKTDSLSCSLGVFVNAGSANETEENNGVAHFIEHMAFKSTKTRSSFEIANEMDMMGASYNAHTSKTETVFHVTGLNKFIENYMDIFGDMLFNPAYKNEEIKNERNVILEEINMCEDNGSTLASNLIDKIYFGEKCPLSRPITGTIKTVKKIKRKDLINFYEKWYQPENIIISFVGNVEENLFLSYVEKYFSNRISQKNNDFKPYILNENNVLSNFGFLYKSNQQSSVNIRMPSYKFSCVNYKVPFLIAEMLGGGMSSRLFQKIREEMGLVYSIYAYNDVRVTGGDFNIFFETSPENVVAVVKAISNVITELVKNGFTDNELKKAKNVFETAFVLSNETTNDKMSKMGQQILLSDSLKTTEESIKELESISLNEINKATKDILGNKNVSIAYVGEDINENLLNIYKK